MTRMPRYSVRDLDYVALSLDDLTHRALLRWAARRIRTLERDLARQQALLNPPHAPITDDWILVTDSQGHTTRQRVPRKFVPYV